MNERIKELAIQAGFFYEDYKDIWYLEYHNESCEEEMKKFAELIVKECYSEVLCQLYDYNPSSNEQFNLGHETGLKLAVSKIKEHFGVEE